MHKDKPMDKRLRSAVDAFTYHTHLDICGKFPQGLPLPCRQSQMRHLERTETLEFLSNRSQVDVHGLLPLGRLCYCNELDKELFQVSQRPLSWSIARRAVWVVMDFHENAV